MLPVAAVALYAVLIFGGQYAMRNKPAGQWRNTLAVWNLGLSAFSWIGMARTLPQLVHNLSTMSLRDNFCLDPRTSYGSGSTGLWVQLFILSKFP
jgi:elongation of very long chain fatty acids protein 6